MPKPKPKPKPNDGSRRYLKAQLRPLTKPIFWASAALFGLSIFVLASLFHQPNQVLGNGDRDAVVNLDGNDSLTPEERAKAAEIDDLSVLLKELDDTGTIDSVSGRLNNKQTANLETPKAIAESEKTATATPSVPPPPTDSGQFEALPLLQLSLPAQGNLPPGSPAGIGAKGSSAFVGFDPRPAGTATAPTQSSSTTTPLADALQNYNAQPGPQGQRSTSNSANNSTSSLSNRRNQSRSPEPGAGTASNGPFPTLIPSYSNPSDGTPNSGSTSYGYGLPGGSSQSRIPQNSSDNAFSQLLNPNLSIPSAPGPAPLNLAPIQPVSPRPVFGATQSNAFTSLPSNRNPSGGTPSGAPSNVSPNPAFGNRPSNVASPAPYSIPNRSPGQYSGNGRINTFANP